MSPELFVFQMIVFIVLGVWGHIVWQWCGRKWVLHRLWREVEQPRNDRYPWEHGSDKDDQHEG